MERKSFLCKITISTIGHWGDEPDGHGSTYNSFAADEDIRASETTPLVRFPESRQSVWRGRMGLAFGILMAMLILGTTISIYLLYLESQADNVLPPVETPLLLVSRREWCSTPELSAPDAPDAPAAPIAPSKHVVVVQTGTATCNDILQCVELLRDLQTNNNGHLPYNFLLSSDGTTFEALGWEGRSPMFPQLSAIVVAFIGNFSTDTPSTSQLEEAFTLFDASNAEGYLTHDFTIVGKITRAGHVPTYLFASLQNLTQWDQTLSDDY